MLCYAMCAFALYSSAQASASLRAHRHHMHHRTQDQSVTVHVMPEQQQQQQADASLKSNHFAVRERMREQASVDQPPSFLSVCLCVSVSESYRCTQCLKSTRNCCVAIATAAAAAECICGSPENHLSSLSQSVAGNRSSCDVEQS